LNGGCDLPEPGWRAAPRKPPCDLPKRRGQTSEAVAATVSTPLINEPGDTVGVQGSVDLDQFADQIFESVASSKRHTGRLEKARRFRLQAVPGFDHNASPSEMAVG